MKKTVATKIIAFSLAAVMASATLAGCTFGFASDPDDPNEVEEKEVIALYPI